MHAKGLGSLLGTMSPNNNDGSERDRPTMSPKISRLRGILNTRGSTLQYNEETVVENAVNPITSTPNSRANENDKLHFRDMSEAITTIFENTSIRKPSLKSSDIPELKNEKMEDVSVMHIFNEWVDKIAVFAKDDDTRCEVAINKIDKTIKNLVKVEIRLGKINTE